jgi:hypothetical protein
VRRILPAIAVILGACAAREPGPATEPFGGKAHLIPGRIEAEHFDEGGEGVAFHDVDAVNEGEPLRAGGADVEKRPDATGGHGIGWTREGEWLVYTVQVTESGVYAIQIPVASNRKGGVFHLEFNGIDRTGPIDVPDTGSWQKLEVIRVERVELRAGRQTMKVVMDRKGPSGSIADIDHFLFLKQ